MKKQQESLKNMVYQAILNGIFTDEYKPNQIINEQELVQKFGCSKTPIREALVTLCNRGNSPQLPALRLSGRQRIPRGGTEYPGFPSRS